MTRILTLGLMLSAVALSACSSVGLGKSYPAPYSHDRTAGHGGSGEAAFEKKMTK